MSTLFLVFNHTVTPEQVADAHASLGVERVISLDGAARASWGQVPPEAPEIREWLEPVRDWLASQAVPGDFVLIQGDFGACWLMVSFCVEKGFIPVYATTAREAVEEIQPDGTVRMTHHFRHRRFRRYGA